MDAAVWLMAHGCRSGRVDVHSSQLMKTLNWHIYSPFRGWRTIHGSSEVIVGFCGGGERQMMRDDERQNTAKMRNRITKWEFYLLEPVWFKLCANKRISFFWWKWKHSDKLRDSLACFPVLMLCLLLVLTEGPVDAIMVIAHSAESAPETSVVQDSRGLPRRSRLEAACFST